MGISPHLLLSDLTKNFDATGQQTAAFADISLSIPSGQFCAIVGPSGCGKTTLLRTVAGLETASLGQMEIKHAANDHRVGMVFQEADLFPWMSLLDNVAFFLRNNPRIASGQAESCAREALEQVGLEEFADYLPDQVSGGMKQRVSIARCFANDADLLLMDEPFVFLDYQSRLQLHQVLLDIWSASNKTVLFVTHDIEEAVFLADRVVVMSPHPGRVIHDIKVHFERPRNLSELRRSPRYIETVDSLTQMILAS